MQRQLASLAGKKVCVIGGTGYVAQAFIRAAVQSNVSVLSISRRGTSGNCITDPLVTYHKGDASNPETFRDQLEECDAVFHTVGTLLDTTITGGKKPGDVGK